MNILITGINGFAGKNFTKLLMKNKNIHITGIDIQDVCLFSGIEYYRKDITKPFHINRHFDFVFHFAALSRTNVNSEYSYSEIYDINVNGTVNVLKSCTFDKLVFLSSTLLYGKTTGLISEKSPVEPGCYYSKTKYEAENIIKKTLTSNQYIILRAVNLAGENQEKVAVIPVFFKQAMSNKDINIFVPSNRSLQFLHIDDLTNLLQKILSQDISGMFNVSSSESIEIIHLAKKIISICNSQSKIVCTDNTAENECFVDSSKIRELMSWKALIGIDEILLRVKKMGENKW